MGSHDGGWVTSGNGGLHFTLAENDAPFSNVDWSVRYTPQHAGCIKLIRNGVTYDVANTGSETIAKFSETGYFLEFWPIAQKPIANGDVLVVEGNFLNAANEVVLKISKTYIIFENGEVTFTDTYEAEPEEPETTTPVVDGEYPGGAMTAHDNGWDHDGLDSNDGIYFKMDGNGAPYNSNWSVEYAPNSADVLKLTRGGQTYDVGMPSGTIVRFSETEHFLKTEAWTINHELLPLQAGDVLTIEGKFVCMQDMTVSLIIPKNTITVNADMTLTFACEDDSQDDGIIQAGSLSGHPNGAGGDGVYATMAENAAPDGSYDGDEDGWDHEYTPVTENAYRVIRDGVEQNIGMPGRGTLVKFSATEYYLKTSGWCLDGFTATTDDIFIIEGQWRSNVDATVVMNITKTYLYHDGTAWVFSTTEPGTEPDVQETTVPEVEETTEPEVSDAYQVGVLSAHEAGGSGTGFHANGLENDAPYSDWAAEYAPTAKECIQIHRGEQVIYRENLGAGAIIKLGGTGYYVKFDTWIDSTNYPLQAGDLIIIEGDFVGTANYAEAEGVKIHIDKTYVVYDGTTFTFSANEPGTEPETTEPEVEETTEPEVEETTAPEVSDAYQVGVLSAHEAGGSGTGFHANGLENDAPYSDWAAEYAPTAKECIQIHRGEQVIYRENLGAGAIIKLGGTGYYVKFDTWIDSTNYPLQAGDLIIIEGDFVGTANYAEAEGVKIHIDKTYVVYDGTTFTFSASEPGTEPDVQETTEPEVQETTVPEADNVYNVGKLASHTNGGSTTGFYATGAANDAPYNEWSIEYKPVSADCIKLTRGGVTTSVGNTGAGTIVKFSATEYYVKCEGWMNGNFPLQAGDEVVVEGKFYNEANDAYIVIEKTTVTFDGTSFLIGVIQAGSLSNHAEKTTSGDGVYATMAENGALSNIDWSVEYTPVAAENYRVIRGGVEQNIGMPGRGTLVKVSEDEYYLKTSGWCLDGFVPTTDDVFIIEGQWRCNQDATVVLNIETTYLYHDGTTWVFSTTAPEAEETTEPEVEETTEPEVEETQPTDDPSVIQAGAMSSQSSGLTADYLNFSMAANDLPNNVTGKAIYRPLSADCIKLVRNGVTYDIGDPAADTILKRTTSNYRLVLAGLAMGELGSLQDGDMLIVSGLFTGGKTTETTVYTFRIATTYISIANGAPTYSETDPRG